jgi:ATP-dependent helicase HrpB
LSEQYPITAIRDEFLSQIQRGPVVVSAPTGSGKSTQVPQWCQGFGQVLVVEPRRIACRALAHRVAELQCAQLGDDVGFLVRDQRRATPKTSIVFATTGVALRLLQTKEIHRFSTVILDEFHERSLDLDLLLALLHRQFVGHLVVMSATIAGDRIATHLGGTHVHGAGRTYPVSIRHVPGQVILPDPGDLEKRVVTALNTLSDETGDILIFMPGKAEIERTAAHLIQSGHTPVLTLHGGLTLEQQSKVFAPSNTRRIIISTNVAETSLTLPRVTAVIDSGLVRRTQYHRDRGYLTLSVIARDSADQRAGRAGRVGPGLCIRLWKESAPLEKTTPPEVYRESLVPLVLAASSCGTPIEKLRFLDAPKDHAVQTARETLHTLGAIDSSHQITQRGTALFQLPIDARLGRLLLEGESQGCLGTVIDLVAAVSTQRSLFHRKRPELEEDDFRAGGCDALALIQALRRGNPGQHGLDRAMLREARQTAKRLREHWAGSAVSAHAPVQRKALALTILKAWPDAAFIARRRKRHIAWSNGGTEVELQDSSAINPLKEDYLIALDSRALGVHRLKRKLIITLAMKAEKTWFIEAGIGDIERGQAKLLDGRLSLTMEHTYAKHLLRRFTVEPTGADAQQAAAQLFLRGRLFRGTVKVVRERLEVQALHDQIHGKSDAQISLEDWVLQRFQDLGVESSDDLELLESEDLTPPALEEFQRAELDKKYPRELNLADALYRLQYHPEKREVILIQVSGQRKSPPPPMYLPRLPGWRMYLRVKDRVQLLRGRS